MYSQVFIKMTDSLLRYSVS